MSKEFKPPVLARQSFAILRELSEHATPNDRARLPANCWSDKPPRGRVGRFSRSRDIAHHRAARVCACLAQLGALFGRFATGIAVNNVDSAVHVAHLVTVHPLFSVADFSGSGHHGSAAVLAALARPLRARGFSEEYAKEWEQAIMGLWRAEGAKVAAARAARAPIRTSQSAARQRLVTAFQRDLTERHLDRLAILAGLHDFGKTLKGFQDKLEGTQLTSRGHVSEALAILANDFAVRSAIQLPLLSEWFDPVSPPLYVAICHHGQPVADDQIRPICRCSRPRKLS